MKMYDAKTNEYVCDIPDDEMKKAEENQPDIWSDEYFPYWDRFYAQYGRKQNEVWISK